MSVFSISSKKSGMKNVIVFLLTVTLVITAMIPSTIIANADDSDTTFNVVFQNNNNEYYSEKVVSGESVKFDGSNWVGDPVGDGGNVFSGWKDQATNQTYNTYDDIKSLPVTSDVTYVSQFETGYNVKLVVDGSTFMTIPVMEGQKLSSKYKSLPTPPIPANKTSFKGWFTSSTEPGSGDKPFNLDEEITGDLTLYGYFKDTYLVQYIDSEGVVKDSFEVEKNGFLPETNYTPTTNVTGSTFRYWVDEDDNRVFPGTTRVNDDMKLTPYFSDIHYVYFITNGSKVETQAVSSGDKASRPNIDPTRKGYVFKGWSTTSGAYDVFNFNTPITKNTFIYASWEGQSVSSTIAYWFEKPNLPAGADMTDPNNYQFYDSKKKNAEAGATVTEPTGSDLIAINHGYYDGMWKSNSSTYMGNGNTTVNLYYKRTVYTISFGLAGGTMTFGGVYYDSTSTPYSFEAKFEQDIRLMWPSTISTSNPDDIGVKYTPASFWGPNNNTRNLVNWSGQWVSHRWDLNDELLEDATLSSDKSKGTKSFNAVWARANTRAVNYYFEKLPGSTDTSISFGNKSYCDTLYSQNINLSGSLSPKSYSGVYNVGTSNIYSGSGSDRYVSNYRFFYDRYRYQLTFDAGPGEWTGGDKQKVIGTKGPSKTGDKVMFEDSINSHIPAADPYYVDDAGVKYTFDGWYYDNIDYFKNLGKDDKMPNSNLTLYAKYKRENVTVTYYDGLDHTATVVGTDAPDLSGYVDPGNAPYKVGDGVADKGQFVTWVQKLGDDYIPFDFDTEITEDLDLYATWKTKGFVLKYAINPGTGTTPIENSTFSLGKSARLDEGAGINAPSGNVFVGWQPTFVNGNTQSIEFPGAIYPVIADTTMQAIYASSGDTVKVTFNSNDTNPDIQDRNAMKNSDIKMPDKTIFSKDYSNLEFLGWSTTKGATSINDVVLKAGDTFNVGSKNHTFYAVWGKKTYNIEFKASAGGSLLPGDETKFTVLEGTKWEDGVTVPAYKVNDGYWFEGWSPELLGNDEIITQDAIYTAVFKAKKEIDIKAADANKIYDGTPLTTNKAFVITSGYDDLSVVATMTSVSTRTNAGSTNNTIDQYVIYKNGKDVTKQYAVNKITGTLKVDKRPVTITATSASFKYDEATHTAEYYDVDGLLSGVSVTGGVDVSGEITYPDESPVANVVTWQSITLNGSNDPDNYIFTPVDGELTMTFGNNVYDLKIEGNTETVKYNGSDQSVTGYDVYQNGSKTTKFTFDGLTTDKAIGKNVEKYFMDLSTTSAFKVYKDGHDVTSAYAVTIEDGWIDIEARPVKITAGNKNFSVTDAGKNNVWHEFTYENEAVDSGLINGHNIPTSKAVFSPDSYVSQPGQTKDNIIDSVVITDGTGVNITSNYAIEFINGTLSMTEPGSWVAYISGPSVTSTYDATEQSIDSFATNLSTYLSSYEVRGLDTAKVAKGTDVGTYYQTMEENKNHIEIWGIPNGSTSTAMMNMTSAFAIINVDNGSLEIEKATITYSAIDQTIKAGTNFTTPSYVVSGFPTYAGQAEKDSIYKVDSNLNESGYLSMKVDGDALADYSLLDTSNAATYDVTWDKGSTEPKNYNVVTEKAKLKILPYGKVLYDPDVNPLSTYSGIAPIDNKEYWMEPGNTTDSMTVTVAGKGTLQRDGYEFAGWEYDGTTYGQNDTFLYPESELGNNITLYAKWNRVADDFSLTAYDGLYDGQAHTIGINGLIQGDMISFEVTDANGNVIEDGYIDYINADSLKDLTRFTDTNRVSTGTGGGITFNIELRDDRENLIGKKSTTLNIRPVPITLQPVYAEKQFDNTPLKATAYTMVGSLVPGESIDDSKIVYEGSITNAGTTASSISAGSIELKTGRNIDNYDITLLPNQLVVTQVQGQIGDESGDPQVRGEDANPSEESQDVLGEEAKTSDSMNLALLAIIAMAAVIALVAVAMRRREQNN